MKAFSRWVVKDRRMADDRLAICLSPAAFDQQPDPPTVTVEAGYSKHRQRDELPLHPELVRELRQRLSAKR